MGCQNDFRILAEGLRLYVTRFRNVEFDLTPEEKKEKTNSFTYKAEPDKLNSAELYNQEEREKYPVISYDFDEFAAAYRTRNFKFDKMDHSIKVVNYLDSVLDLAEIINNGIKKVLETNDQILLKHNNERDKAQYQILKNTVNGYLDILLEIKARKDDFTNSPYVHYFENSYSELDSYSRLIITSHSIPDEMSVSFNSLYMGIPLNKFSEQKSMGVSKSFCMANFAQLAEKMYRIIHIFFSNLINEFSAYVTPELFLNNPEKEALIVIPLNMYKKFNFQHSGLHRQEVVFIDNKDPAKTAANYSQFIEEVRDGLKTFMENARKLKASLSTMKDDREIEFLMEKYANFYKNTTDGRISKLQDTCHKNSGFREKLTSLMYEIRSEIVEIATLNENPWEIKIDSTKENKSFDKDCCHYVSEICRCYFGDKEMPTVQLQRFIHLFTYQVTPIKAMCNHMKNCATKDVKWASKDKDKILKVLYR